MTQGMYLRQKIFRLQSVSSVSERGILSSASFLNFIRWIAQGGFCHLRRG